MDQPPVFLISNSMIPGFQSPSAAPGLRVYGLQAGLAGNGIASTIILPKTMVDRQVDLWGGAIAEQAPAGAVIVENRHILDYLVQHAPATVIVTNGGGATFLRKHPLLRVGLDFFSPTVLEHSYRGSDVASIIQIKKNAIELADFFFVNGSRRVPYCHGWLASCGIDIRELDIPAINMSIPFSFHESPHASDAIKINVAGYNHVWAPLPPVLKQLETLALQGLIRADISTAADYWVRGEEAGSLAEILERLSKNDRFRVFGPMRYESLSEILGQADLVVDMFANNVERYYSMSTRGVVALAHGIPVVHPAFTELGELLQKYDAGWCSESGINGYADCVEAAVNEIDKQPEILEQKIAGARKLVKEKFNPVIETRKLVSLLEW